MTLLLLLKPPNMALFGGAIPQIPESKHEHKPQSLNDIKDDIRIVIEGREIVEELQNIQPEPVYSDTLKQNIEYLKHLLALEKETKDLEELRNLLLNLHMAAMIVKNQVEDELNLILLMELDDD